jgi:manganese/zinc/iron transport system substrate-binding protein
MHSYWGLFLALIALLLGFGCGGNSSSERAAGETYKVVATIGMIADVVRNIAGEKASVVNIIGEGVDPHLYNPTRSDVVALTQADVIFCNGLLLEGRMNDVLGQLQRRGRPVHAVAEGMLRREGYIMQEEGEGYDPHVWMDVRGWIGVAEIITDALVDFDPENEGFYRERAAQYIGELEKLDAYARQVIATVPQDRRVLVTAHDAFQYLGRAHDIEVRGIQGMSTESEAGVRDIEQLIRFLIERKIPAVFIESSLSNKNVRALIEGANAKGFELKIGGELYSDAMGSAGTYHGTYIGMIDHNVSTIAKALGGSVPEGGFRGWNALQKDSQP